MKFSIITPTFNHSKYIKTTIESVLANKSPNIEIEYIIIDGQSSDNTKDIIKQYKKYIHTFISEPDDGQVDAINKGFSLATGDIYAYINSDDYYYPNIFDKIAKIFNENPNIDIIYGDCAFVTQDGQFMRYFTEIEPFDAYRLTSCSDFIMQPACFWRSSIYKKCNKFDKKFHFGFDWDMWCRMYDNNANFYYYKELLAINRDFVETKTQTGGIDRLKELKIINNIHKQSILPYAYYSYYCAYHIYNIPNNIILKIIQFFKLKIFKLLNFKTILYNNRYFYDKNLYGLIKHSPLLNKTALLSIPIYDKLSNPTLFLSLSSNIDEQSGSITINNDKKINFIFQNNIFKITYKLPINNIYNIKIQFTKEMQKFKRKKDKLLRKQENISAQLIHFSIVEEDLQACKYYTHS
jgi:glycosyltransferase involved in cell wall biosynthesis